MSGDVMSVPLDEASLTISGVLQPGLDEIEWLAALDLLAGECKTPTPAGISRYLFDELAFCGNRQAYYDWRNSLTPIFPRESGMTTRHHDDGLLKRYGCLRARWLTRRH